MTERLYYTDAYLREFRAHVVERTGDVVYLDRTAFYPTSGGQPFDTGTINGVPVVEVIDEDERIAHRTAHRTAAPVEAEEADCIIDWPRRFDHMQQHTGQHLLSAVFAELYHAPTLSFHLGEESSTIDLGVPKLDDEALRAVERRANAAVFENRAVTVTFEDAASAEGLRKPSSREGSLRIIGIEGLDRSACGGTHVRATGEIGPILIRKTERIRNSVRVEFLCGGRAVARARADYEALSHASRLFSAPLDDVPEKIAAQLEEAHAGEKARKKLASELAVYRGRELYHATTPDAAGFRRATERLAAGNLEELRAMAQSFTAEPKAVFLAVLEQPPSVLLAVSEDAGLDAGQMVKAAVTAAGGRGGGTPRIAQGSIPSADRLAAVAETLLAG